MSVFFVKFSYNQTIKKVQFTKDQLNWENICSILMKAFLLSEKDRIQLKYKDLENDEITVNSDDDLQEAYNLYFMKNLIRFIVYYSGVFDENKPMQNTGYSKIERPRALSASLEEQPNLKNSHSNEVINLEKSEAVKESALANSHTIVGNKSPSKNVKIDSQELQNIFTQVFSTTDILKKIQDKLANYISKEDSKESEGVEYSIDTDYQAITNYMMTTLNHLINNKTEVNQIQEEEKVEESRETKPRSQSLDANQGLLDVSMSESILVRSEEHPVAVEKPVKDQFSTSTDLDFIKLSSTFGVKLVLKYENGKARFVSVPMQDFSIIDSQSHKEAEPEKEEQENIEEKVENIVLSLKKKPSVEKKASEFSKNILKANVHDLDDDLPAPYDKKVVQKVDQLAESLYEKIE